jgi:hypothetical protein
VVLTANGRDTVKSEVRSAPADSTDTAQLRKHLGLFLSRPQGLTADRFFVHCLKMPWNGLPSSRDALVFYADANLSIAYLTFYNGWKYQYSIHSTPIWDKLKIPYNVELTDLASAHTVLVWWNHVVRRSSYGIETGKTWIYPPSGISIFLIHA